MANPLPPVPPVPPVPFDPLSLPWSDDWARFGDATSMPAAPYRPRSGLTLFDSTAGTDPVRPAGAPIQAQPAAQPSVRPVRPVSRGPAGAPGRPVAGPMPKRTDLARAMPTRVTPTRVTPTGAMPSRATPGRVMPNRPTPSRPTPTWAASESPRSAPVRRQRGAARTVRMAIGIGVALLIIYARIHGGG